MSCGRALDIWGDLGFPPSPARGLLIAASQSAQKHTHSFVPLLCFQAGKPGCEGHRSLWIGWTLAGFPDPHVKSAWQGAEPTWELCVMLVKGQLRKKPLMSCRSSTWSAEADSIPTLTFTSSISWSPCLANVMSAPWLRRMGGRCCPHLCDPLLGLLRLLSCRRQDGLGSRVLDQCTFPTSCNLEKGGERE